ncbi:TPA: AAA family ATPase, partial [Streptococcus suis]
MKIKNLGPISEISLELMNGLIFIGPNNSGKTYLTYTLYSILNIIDSTSCD